MLRAIELGEADPAGTRQVALVTGLQALKGVQLPASWDLGQSASDDFERVLARERWSVLEAQAGNGFEDGMYTPPSP